MTRQISAIDTARHILAAHAQGEDVVTVTAVAGAAAGQRMLMRAPGDVLGTFGDAGQDQLARSLAQRVFDAREPLLEDGFFAELHTPADSLIIFGAGHIAMPLAELGTKLGFAVTVLDDRPEFADEHRFPAAVRVRPLDLSAPLRDLRIDSQTYVVLVTRAHEHDFDCLRDLLQLEQQPCYVGMLGSRRRVRAAFTALLDGGTPRENLRNVHAPIGLDIGAETPVEIALSIAAELVRVRRGGSAESLAGEERVLERFFVEGK